MNLRGLEVLLGTLAGVLLVLGVTSGLTLGALGWAVTGVACVLLTEAIVLRHLLPHYGATQHWGRVASRLPGVRLLGDGGRNPPRLRGTLGECSVRIDRAVAGWKTSVAPIHRDDHADVQLSLRWADGQRGRRRTGDRLFDRLVEVQGAVPEGLLVLDHSVRQAVMQALGEGVEINFDRVQWASRTMLSAREVADRLNRMAALTRALYALTPAQLRARARRTIVADPHPEVRARTLWLYQEHYALDRADLQMVCAAADDPDPRVRLAAAGARIATDADTASAEAMLAEAVARGESPAWALDDAVARLVEYGRPEVVSAAMQARLRSEGALPVEVLKWALAQRPARSAQPLGARLVRAPEGDAIAAVDVLVGAGVALEPALIALVAHASDAVVDRVVDGLAFGGTHRSVGVLRQVTRCHRRPRRLRHAAADAIAAIRARGPKGSSGRLSLIDPTSPVGRLSVAGDR